MLKCSVCQLVKLKNNSDFLLRLLARDAGGETEGVLLNETVPAWVVDIVVEKKLPKFIKVIIFD